MKKLRDWIVLLMVAAVFAVSLVLLRRVVGFATPLFGVVVMFDFLGLVAFARPLFVLKVPGFLRKEREWEANGRIYKALGVPEFGALLRRSPLRYLNPLVYLRQQPDPAIVLAQIESSEAAHLLAAVIVVPYMIYSCIRGWWGAVVLLTVVQIVGNLYPIMHLRWVRIRINRLYDRILSNRKGGV